MVGTETEDVFLNTLPEGFRTTFLDSDRLRRLTNQDVSTLNDTVEDYGDYVVTEREIITNLADRVNTSFLTPERTIELPGLQLALDPDVMPGTGSLLEQFVALYKADNDTPSGTVKDPARATVDDIVFSWASPEVYNQINDNGGSVSNFVNTGLTAGDELQVVGQGGVDTGVNTDGNSLNLDPDEYLFFTGDYIDLSDGKSIVTATELVDVDGEDYGPQNFLFQNRLSGAHIATSMGFYATDTVDLDAKVYDDGDSELVPVAFYVADGGKAPALV